MNSLQEILCGKALLQDELTGYELNHEDVTFQDSISVEQHKYRCNRCGTKEKHHFYQHYCARCQKECIYCRNCIMMGKCTSCNKLVLWQGDSLAFPHIQQALQWQGQLSPGQQTASDKVRDTIINHGMCLVWAVCGAGKTEVLFEGIAYALSKGQRVCIATPRTDVVLELVPRFKAAFPTTLISALYGGSEEKHLPAQLVISTTHQLLRYQQAFDVIIIDEVDAFPYSIDKTLQFAVKKSLKTTSSLIYLTATPSRTLQKLAYSGKLPYVIIPARYHRQPIPVPQLKWCGNWKKVFQKGRIPKALCTWYEHKLQTKTPFLIFFPNIELMNAHVSLFSNIEAVYAEDPNRKTKVQALREQKMLGLLTTTILERGVTIPKLEVAVIGAEEEIFTESALVQIAGRVGRSAQHPNGNVTFFHYGKTRAMIQAVRQIQRMNAEGRERGLLDE